jgi:hypothetical protein
LPSLGASSARTPSRFERRQASLRASSSLSSSHSASFSSQSSGSIKPGISPQQKLISHSAVASPPPRQPSAADGPGSQQSSGSNYQPPEPMLRTGTSILQAASSSTVRYTIAANDFMLLFARSTHASLSADSAVRSAQARARAAGAPLSRIRCERGRCSRRPSNAAHRAWPALQQNAAHRSSERVSRQAAAPNRLCAHSIRASLRSDVYFQRGMMIAAVIAERSCPEGQATPVHCSQLL